MRARLVSALVACLLLSATFAFGQLPAPPPPSQGPVAMPPGAQRPGMPPTRDNASTTSPTGTGRIRGRVLAAETGNPLRLAQVRLSAPDVRISRFANTDTEGRYEFTELPAARYTVSASKASYVTLQFGQQRAFEPGGPLELADGQIAGSVDFSLPRGSVITGRISDEYGEPIAQAQVFAMRYQFMPGGQRRLTPIGMPMMTDDLGQYRIFGLSPGEYLVSATVRTQGLFNAGPAPASDVSDPTGYPTTYYPGTTSVANAQGIIVGLGQEAAAYFSLASARLVRVSGRIIDSQGRPVIGAMLQLRSNANMTMTMFLGGIMTQTDGSFSVVNMQPGEYSIDVRPQSRTPNPEEVESASVSITVGNEDIAGLLIATGKGATVLGRVIFDAKAPPPPGQNPLSIMPSPADPQMAPMMFRETNGVVGEDGRFQMRGVFGKMLLRPTGLPPNWTLKSVTLDGQDITDVAYDFKSSGTVTGIEVVISDRSSTNLSGTVRDSRGQQVKDYVVALFPRELREGTDARRFVRSTRPDQEGRYQTRGLPPGDYFAAAVESLEQGREWDPSFQEQMRPRAKSFSLKEGESLMLDLPLESAP